MTRLLTIDDLIYAVHSGKWFVDGESWTGLRRLALLDSLRRGYPIGCFVVADWRCADRVDLIDGRARALTLASAIGPSSPVVFDVDALEFIEGEATPLRLPLTSLRPSSLMDFIRPLPHDEHRRRRVDAVNSVGKILHATVPVVEVNINDADEVRRRLHENAS